MRLFVGAVCREVVAAIADAPPTIGMTVSKAQSWTTGGYIGMTPEQLRRAVGPFRWLQRDHMTDDTTEVDSSAKWNGTFVDSDNVELYRRAAQFGLTCEVGNGETQGIDVNARIALAESVGAPIFSVSSYAGTSLSNCRNIVDVQACDRQEYKWPKRAHNCDFLKREDYAKLRFAGYSHFNVAPEVGYVAMLGYIRRANGALNAWREEVWRDGRWKRWTSDPLMAVLAGGHYCLESMPKDIRAKHYAAVVTDVRSYIMELLRWTS